MEILKRYWLRGGIIAIIIATVVSIASIFFMTLRLMFVPGGIVKALIDEVIFGGTIYYPTSTGSLSLTLAILTSFIIYFIIGLIIGILFDKIHR